LNFYNPASSGWESDESQEISSLFSQKSGWIISSMIANQCFANYLGYLTTIILALGYVYDSYLSTNRNLIYTGYAKTKEFSSTAGLHS
jgi:hypothetical protein